MSRICPEYVPNMSRMYPEYAQVAQIAPQTSKRTASLSLRSPLELLNLASSKAARRRDFALERQLWQLESMCVSIKQQVPYVPNMS